MIRHDLDDGEPSSIPGHGTVRAPSRPIQRRARGDPAPQPLLGRLHPHFLTRRAEPSHEPLRDDPAERTGDLVTLNADVHQTRHRVSGVVRVLGREHQVPRERCLHGNLRRLAIPDLPYQHHVRILPEDRAQRRRERQPRLLLHLHLDEARHPVLDRVLDRDDVHTLALDVIDAGVQRRGLARAGGPGDENDPLVEFQ